MDSRVSQLESQMKEVRTQTENETHGALTATGAPQLKEATDFFLGIGAVYQMVSLGQTDFAVTSDYDFSTPYSGSFKEMKDHWAWGINAQAGYNFKHDHAYVALTNNYFDSSVTTKVDLSGPSTILPTRLNSLVSSSDYAYSASSNWDIGYDLLGLEVGKDFFVSRYFSFKPSFGLLTSWMWLKNNISYTGDDFDTNSAYVEDQSNFWGIGPQIGTVVNVGLMNGFALFADIKGAMMYGRFTIKHNEINTNGDNELLTLKAPCHRIIPYVSAILGLSYDMTTEQKGHHFKFRAGYNAQYFLNANQMIYPVSTEHNSDYDFKKQEGSLQTSGLILDMTWSF